MKTDYLRKIFIISIPLFIAHGIEEYLTRFYIVDDFLFGHLDPKISGLLFVIFQLLFWCALIAIAFKKFSPKWFLVAIGLIYIFELHHLVHTVFIDKAYYPGTITALGFPILAFLFWKELIKGSKKYVRN